METDRARELLAAERKRIERELARVGREDDGEPADEFDPANLASDLYQDEFDAGRADGLREPLRCRMGVRIEGSARIPRIPGPPADSDLLRIHRVAHDEVFRRGLSRPTREETHREVERPPPRIDGRRAPAVRSA